MACKRRLGALLAFVGLGRAVHTNRPSTVVVVADGSCQPEHAETIVVLDRGRGQELTLTVVDCGCGSRVARTCRQENTLSKTCRSDRDGLHLQDPSLQPWSAVAELQNPLTLKTPIEIVELANRIRYPNEPVAWDLDLDPKPASRIRCLDLNGGSV